MGASQGGARRGPGGAGSPSDSSVRTAGVRSGDPCPCGSGLSFGQCCEPIHDGAPAPTADALMRSRFSAFVVGDEDYLFRSWHPRTRPEGPYCDPCVAWEALEVHEVEAGGPGDDAGVVTFTARYRTSLPDGVVRSGMLRERSAFVRRRGRWVYLDSL